MSRRAKTNMIGLKTALFRFTFLCVLPLTIIAAHASIKPASPWRVVSLNGRWEIINEYGSLWLTREGYPATTTDNVYETLISGRLRNR